MNRGRVHPALLTLQRLGQEPNLEDPLNLNEGNYVFLIKDLKKGLNKLSPDTVVRYIDSKSSPIFSLSWEA